MNGLINEDGEVAVRLADGWSLRSGARELTSGEYVRLVDPSGDEYAYWDNAEWVADPVLVMGAIMNSAAGLRVKDAAAATEATDDDLADGRECELTYMIVVNVHPEDGEPDGDLPDGAPVEFYKLPDDVAETLKDLGNDYLRDVSGVEPASIRFLA